MPIISRSTKIVQNATDSIKDKINKIRILRQKYVCSNTFRHTLITSDDNFMVSGVTSLPSTCDHGVVRYNISNIAMEALPYLHDHPEFPVQAEALQEVGDVGVGVVTHELQLLRHQALLQVLPEVHHLDGDLDLRDLVVSHAHHTCHPGEVEENKTFTQTSKTIVFCYGKVF